MRKIWIFFLVGLIWTMSCKNNAPQKLMIATAANMQFAMDELISTFQEQTNIDCELVVSSSGKLTAQIKAGAPYDIFASADLKFPNELYKTGYATSPPLIYAFGKIVLWSIVHQLEEKTDLTLSKFKKIAIANPKTAPYGKASIDWLKKNNLLEKIEDKLVFGESISQVNQFVFSKSADIGFTSKSVVLSSKLKNKGSWLTINSETNQSIQQGIVLLKNSNSNIEKSKQFIDFIYSEKGKFILEKYGYETNSKKKSESMLPLTN